MEEKDVQEQNTQTKKTKKPFYKKWWFWVVLIVIVAIIGSVAGSMGSSSNNNNNPSNEVAQTYGLNEKVTVGDLEVTVLSVYDTKQIGAEYLNESTDNNFVVITVKIKNNSTSEKYIGSSSILYYRGDSEYQPHTAGLYLTDGFWLNVTIGAGITKEIQVAYEIPSTHQTTDYFYIKDGFLSNEKIYMV